jgi:hypothetical protein
VTPPTGVDVLIEVDVLLEDETAGPLEKSTITVTRTGGLDRSKRLATIGAEAHEEVVKKAEQQYPVSVDEWAEYCKNKRLASERMKLDMKSDKEKWAILNWNNPHNKAKNEIENKEDNEEDASTAYWTAGSWTYWTARPDHHEEENWSFETYQQDNSTISSVLQTSEDGADEEDIHPGITQTGRYQFEVEIDVDEWIGETVAENDWNNWTIDTDYINDELDSIYSGKCWEVQQYLGYQIAADKQHRLTQELMGRLKRRGITVIMKESSR